jgi:hypothetical protein
MTHSFVCALFRAAKVNGTRSADPVVRGVAIPRYARMHEATGITKSPP